MEDQDKSLQTQVDELRARVDKLDKPEEAAKSKAAWGYKDGKSQIFEDGKLPSGWKDKP